MSIPDFQSVMRPVLAAVADGVPLALSALREQIANEFQHTEMTSYFNVNFAEKQSESAYRQAEELNKAKKAANAQ